MLSSSNLVGALEAAPGDRHFITFCIDEDERESVTFGEFRRRARNEAAHLQQRGLSSGDRVIILMPQGISAMCTFAAAMMLGAVPAFLAYPNFKIDPSKYRSGLAGVTANLHATAVVINQEFPQGMLECVSIGSDAMLIRTEDHSPEKVHWESKAKIDPDGLAFIQHSAGTTGLQKGVALTHLAVLRQIDHLTGVLKLDPTTDRVYSWLPLYHDMGLIACFMLPMVLHIPLVMQSPLDWVMRPETALQIISEHKCTLAWMPNFAFQFIPRRTPKHHWDKYDLSSLRLLINCSEPVRASSMKEFQQACGIKDGVLQTSYAMAENVFAVTQSNAPGGPASLWADAQRFRSAHRIAPVSKENPGAIHFLSSGRLLANQKVRIISEAGETAPEDQVGEIAIKTDCLFDGYYNRPDLTAASFLDGWYRTGDLGFLKDGELYVVGRKKDLLIIGGENIYPQDIEEIVAAHPAIHDGRAIALGCYNPDLGTEDILVVAEVEREEMLANSESVEQEIRIRVVAGLGIAVRTILLKPPKWIVKSTAGKPSRSATREKVFREHPEFNREPRTSENEP